MEKDTCKMGWHVKNVINGTEYYVLGKLYWMFGCDRIIVAPTKREPNALITREREFISEEFLEHIPSSNDSEFEKEFIKPDLDKYFGMLCKDKVTGFTGVAIGCITSMISTDSYALEPLSKKKRKKYDHEWFDVGRLEIISRQVTPAEVKSERPGGCDVHMTNALAETLC